MSDITIAVRDQSDPINITAVCVDETPTIQNVYDSVGLQGPQGIQGPVGPAGPNEIGGFPISLSNPKDGDTIQLQSWSWKNTPQEALTDGGNF